MKNLFPDLGKFLLAAIFALAATDRLSADQPKIAREQAEALLNGVAAMAQLPQIEQATPGILSAIEFSPGHRYSDFNPASDKVATYGLTALVAGGVAAKLGLFKGLWTANHWNRRAGRPGGADSSKGKAPLRNEKTGSGSAIP